MSKKHLFIDDGEVERIANLARKLHQPSRFTGHAVLRPEHRWENCAIQIRTTPAWDPQEQLFKMIYLASAEGPDPEVKLDPTGAPAGGESFYCYATSADGVNWEKPMLGLYDYPVRLWNGVPIGGRNNILPSAQGLLLGPVRDPGETDPSRRFKGLAYRGGSLEPLVSPDALRWENPGLDSLSSADESHLTLDEERRLFIATVKHGGPYGRSFFLTTSEDFSHWSDQELVFHADQTDQEKGNERLQRFFDDPALLKPVYNRPEEWRTDVYNFPVFPYEGLYLALPVMHHWSGKHPPMYENVDSRKTVELASSRDLRRWERAAGRAPFIEQAPTGQNGAYDTGQLVTTNGPLVRNRELWFYYVGLKYRCLSLEDTRQRKYLDTGAVCMARLRLDGFVSLKGGSEWGSVLTRPLRVEGRELRINVDAWRGQVKTEILDAGEERVLPGFGAEDCLPTSVDSIDEPVRWRGHADLSALAGRTVRLRFSILRGELYAFWFAG
ncbi:MAG: hypothetical protein HYW07_13550 [Candidatus Latescibacteria bacterium]|nr:hypothetical protein [Candidatus Latescibacterota bacterium]